MPAVLPAIIAEYHRYKALADRALAQLDEDQLAEPALGGGNSVAVLAWHVGGNLASRFTDFLTSDGEKPWRHRDQEFAARRPSRAELQAHWDRGWSVLFAALAELRESDLDRTVTIRGTELSVVEALHRSLAHTAYHVGQMVMLARSLRGDAWEFLSIPPGGTAAYNAQPTSERADEHARRLEEG